MTHDTAADPVRLRVFTLDDCTIEEANVPTPETDPFDFFGFYRPDYLRQSITSGEAFPKPGALNGRLAVEAEGAYVGHVMWHPQLWGPIGSPAASFGIGLIPAARGKGYGTQAQRLLVAYLFQNTTTSRAEAVTDVENIAEQRSLEKAGLLREGIIRSAHFRAGTYHDMVLYAITRADFEEAQAGAKGSKVTTGFSA